MIRVLLTTQGYGFSTMEDALCDEDIKLTEVLSFIQSYRKIHPLFVPRLLINLGAGHISMRYGFKVRTLPLVSPIFTVFSCHLTSSYHPRLKTPGP